ncbi:MAG: type II secretion system F family protein [Nitrospiraceae bacterium]
MLTGLIALGIFATVLLLLEGGYYVYRTFAYRKTEQVIERLQAWSTEQRSRDQIADSGIVRKDVLSDIPWLNDLLIGFRKLDSLRSLHTRARATLPLGAFLILSGLLAITMCLVCTRLGTHLLVTVGVAGAGAALPFLYLWRKKTKRMAEFHRQLPEALELVARALHSGHAFFVGMKLVGEEFADPIGTEFKQAFSEVSMGFSVPQALQNLANRVDCVDMKFFVTSVNLQRETGGNLAEIIESLSELIRKRFELQMKVKVLSAEGRFSAIILFGLPLALGALLYKTNPEYISLLFTDPLGHMMVTVGALLMVIGTLVTKRMVAIKV